MKKVFAVLMTLILVLSVAACGEPKTQEDEEPTRSEEELIAEIKPLAEKLVKYKAQLDPLLTLADSGGNKFSELDSMAEAGVAFDAVFAQMNMDAESLTDGDISPVKNLATAKQAADQIAEISKKINKAAQKYYAQFIAAFPDAEITKIYCLTVFTDGEPVCFFAADYADIDGTEKTVYSLSSFGAITPDDVLASIHSYLFSAEPIAARNAVKDGNFRIDLNAVKMAVAPETATETSAVTEETEPVTELISGGDVLTDGNAK